MSNNTKNIIHLGYGRYVNANDVSCISQQKSAKFLATTDGHLNGTPVDEVSDDELTIDAFVVVTPKIGQPIGLRTTDDKVEAYTTEVVNAVNESRDVVHPSDYEPSEKESPEKIVPISG